MTRGARTALFLVAAAVFTVLFGAAIAGMPPFGSTEHPYRDRAVAASIKQATANVVSSVNFDQRGFDTFIEETILLGSVVGAAALLRPAKTEKSEQPRRNDPVPMDGVVLLSAAILPATLLVGLDVVAHGHLTPGGGFQGGVVLATGVHLLYLAGRYETLRRLRPLGWYEWSEGLSTAVFAGMGVAGLAAGGGFLANVLPKGSFGALLSAGTVPVLNIAVGGAVAGGAVVLLASFLDQAMRADDSSGEGES